MTRLSPIRRGLLIGVVVIVALVPAIVVGFALVTMNAELTRVSSRSDRQGDALVALGYPRDGSRGRRGPAGADGVNGTNGVDGVSIRGQQGPTGSTGSQGAAGANGQNGRNGTDGATGKQGPSGVSIVGPQGPKGDTGATGAQGSVGPTGPEATAISVPNGQGGWCLATDEDGDGVYKCPDAESK